MANKMNSRTPVTKGSGNVFADLGLPDAGEKQTKVRLAVAINEIIETMSQTDAAQRLRINQPEDFRPRELPPQWVFRRAPHQLSKCTRSGRRNRNSQAAIPSGRQDSGNGRVRVIGGKAGGKIGGKRGLNRPK